jgi:hypothetical protein
MKAKNYSKILIAAILTPIVSVSILVWSIDSQALDALKTGAACIAAIFAIGTAVSAYTAFRTIKATALYKLTEEWRLPPAHEAFSYVNELRRAWKREGGDSKALARRWVIENFDQNIPEKEKEKRKEANLHRRYASQLLAKMSALVERGYLSYDDWFRVMPEVGRHLVVLHPIEQAINEYWDRKEREECSTWDGEKCVDNRIAIWDRPWSKWEFEGLLPKYENWYRKNAWAESHSQDSDNGKTPR